MFCHFSTAYFVIGLIAATRKGADILNDFGWEAVRHKHGEVWPVLEESGDYMPFFDEAGLGMSMSSLSLSSSAKSDARGSSLLVASISPRDGSDVGDSPRDSGSVSSSPKPGMFYIEEPGSKSRSNTGSSVPTTNASSGNSPSASVEGVNRTSGESPIYESPSGNPDIQRQSADEPHNAEIETKARSGSVPSPPVSAKLDVPHPRSQSDPVRTTDGKHDTHAITVHFQDNVSDDSDSQSSSSLRIQKSPRLSPRLTKDALLRKRVVGNTISEKAELVTVREQRSSSNESSKASSALASMTSSGSKGHSDSINTYVTTSGISSYESPQPGGGDQGQLTPIPSASSVLTDSERKRLPSDQDSPTPLVHPSDVFRKLANLKRVPSLKRRYSNPVLGHISPHTSLDYKEANGNTVHFSSAKDLQGYAALRELKKQRTSSDLDRDGNMTSIFEETKQREHKLLV